MFSASSDRILASMSDIDRRVDLPPLDWSELGVSGLLPTGMATLLADVEGSTRLWEAQPEEMTSAISRLNQTVSEVIAAQLPTQLMRGRVVTS
jgi:class 3 adenylate cyclase